MQKFTVFTAILTVIIVVVVAEILVSEYFPSLKAENTLSVDSSGLVGNIDLGDATAANIFNSALENEAAQQLGGAAVDQFNSTVGSSLENINNFVGTAPDDSRVYDFEDQDEPASQPNAFLDAEKLSSAGFYNAFLEVEEHDGLLFKNIFVEDVETAVMTKYAIRTNEQMLAKVHVFQMKPGARASELYNALNQRISNTISLDVNATNSFGEASFYMNDPQREDVAFLVVRMGTHIFGFSYPKEFHQQIVNLIQLLDLEF